MTDKAPVPTFCKGQRVRILQSLKLQLEGLSGQIGSVEKVYGAGGCLVRLDGGEVVWIARNDLKRELIL